MMSSIDEMSRKFVRPVIYGFMAGSGAAPPSASRLETGTRSAMATAKRMGRLGVSKGAKTTARLAIGGRGIFAARRMKRTYEILKQKSTQVEGCIERSPSLSTRAACGALSGIVAWMTVAFGDLTFKTPARRGVLAAGPAGVAKLAVVAAASLPLFDHLRLDGGGLSG